MKYKKGTFVVVPNKDNLKGKPAEMQTIYFWLCEHSDDEGQCFPTKTTISKEAGCSHNTVDKYLKQLVLDGFLTIEQRKKKGSKENTSNMYQLQILGEPPTNSGMTPPPNSGSETNPSINQPHLTTITDEIKEESNIVTLPVQRGKQPSQRLLTIYKDLFKFFYGFEYKTNFGRDLKILKDLTGSYSELQIARMLTIFFNWHGMTGSDDREFNYLSGNNFPIALFKSTVVKYETYSRNILQEKFDDDRELLIVVGKHIMSLK